MKDARCIAESAIKMVRNCRDQHCRPEDNWAAQLASCDAGGVLGLDERYPITTARAIEAAMPENWAVTVAFDCLWGRHRPSLSRGQHVMPSIGMTRKTARLEDVKSAHTQGSGWRADVGQRWGSRPA